MANESLNCRQFDRLFQQVLDERGELTANTQLRQHAADCPPCREQLETWDLVQQHQASTTNHRSHHRVTETIANMQRLSLAAAVLLLVGGCFWWLGDRSVAPVVGEPPTTATHLASIEPSHPADLPSSQTVAWWTSDAHARWLDAQDWIDQTMPAVDSLREGVAPIGRSLGRAITLLATGSGAQTS